MKKLLLSILIFPLIITCKKTEYSPEGPTDIRVRNLSSDITFLKVIVNTSATVDTLGNIGPGEVSEYFRFEKAYPKAEITATVNGQVFSTGTVDYTYMQYIGRDRITYEVFISDMNARELSISNVIIEEPLVLK